MITLYGNPIVTQSDTMANLQIHQFPCLSDNYGVLVHDPDAGLTAAIDAPDAAAVRQALAAKGWKLTHIFNTHHHGDHTGGNLALKDETGCSIIGPRGELARIPGIDKAVGEGDTFAFGTAQVHVLDTPGHTAGHITTGSRRTASLSPAIPCSRWGAAG